MKFTALNPTPTLSKEALEKIHAVVARSILRELREQEQIGHRESGEAAEGKHVMPTENGHHSDTFTRIY